MTRRRSGNSGQNSGDTRNSGNTIRNCIFTAALRPLAMLSRCRWAAQLLFQRRCTLWHPPISLPVLVMVMVTVHLAVSRPADIAAVADMVVIRCNRCPGAMTMLATWRGHARSCPRSRFAAPGTIHFPTQSQAASLASALSKRDSTTMDAFPTETVHRRMYLLNQTPATRTADTKTAAEHSSGGRSKIGG